MKASLPNIYDYNNFRNFLGDFQRSRYASDKNYSKSSLSKMLGLPNTHIAGRPAMKSDSNNDMHAGESETSDMLIARPDLVHRDRAGQQSGADQHRLSLPGDVYTGIWWYAHFPNHYSGDGTVATRELGEFDQKAWSTEIAAALKAIKADDESLKLQNEFYEKAQHPLDTKQ